MNMRHHVDNKLQYDYLINRIRPKKRFKKWDKKQDNEKYRNYQGILSL